MTSATGNDPAPGSRLQALGGRLRPAAGGRGLTLIEILISIAILAFAVVLIMQSLARGAHALAVAKNRLRAYTFASSKMADLETTYREGGQPDPGGHFRMGRDEFDWRLETAPSVEDPRLELVTLTVEWHQGRDVYQTQLSGLMRAAEPAVE